MNFCPKCGAKIESPDSKFCAICGEKLSQNDLFGGTGEGSPAPQAETPMPDYTAPGETPQRPRPAPAPSAGGRTPQQSSSSPAQNGMTASFTSPFVKDASTPAGQDEPLFSPVFAEEESDAPAQQAPSPEKQPASLFDQDAPVPQQKAPTDMSALENLLDAEDQGAAESAETTPPETDFFAESAESAEGSAGGGEKDGLFSEAEDKNNLFAEAETLGGEAVDETASGLFDDAQPLEGGAAAEQDLFEGAQPLEDAPPARQQTEGFPPVGTEEPPHPAPAPRQEYPIQREAPQQQAKQHASKAPSSAAQQQYVPPQSTSRQKEDMVAGISQAAEAAQSVEPTHQAPVQRIPSAGQSAPVQQQYTGTTRGGTTLAEASSAARRGAPERRQSQQPQRSRQRRGGSGNTVRNILIGVLVGLVLLFVAILGFLYWQNRPAKTIDAFTEALAARDYQTLASSVSVVGVTTSGSEGWIALCDAFQEEDARAALSKEMARTGADPTTDNLTYPSVRLQGDTLFLFIKQYHVRLTGVEMLAPGAADGTMARLAAGDEFSDHTGTPNEEGVLYGGIMPGRYTVTLNSPDGTAADYVVDAFQLKEPNRIEEGAPAEEGEEAAPSVANITVENCISDDAQIFLNGQETPAKPSGGVVQLSQVELGTVISISAEVDGSLQEASVTFSDPNVTTLRFENYNQTPLDGAESTSTPTGTAALSADAATSALTTFYQSYLDAINAQSLDGIQNSTSSNTQNLEARITSPANQANTYTFGSVTVDPASITAVDENTVTFTATCSFSYAPKDDAGNTQTGSNVQSVRMVNQNGQWLVDSFTNA